MSKYFTFRQDYDKVPKSQENFIKALKHIGMKDPEKIVKTSLYSLKPDPEEKLTDKEYIGRGILNVRKVLNRNLGLSGKYKNRMIRFCAEIETVKIENGNVWLKAKLPYKEYKKIVDTTYTILKKCDKQYCNKLLQEEEKDFYIQKNFYRNRKFKTIAPIQTNMIVRTNKGKTEQITEFTEEFKKFIIKEN